MGGSSQFRRTPYSTSGTPRSDLSQIFIRVGDDISYPFTASRPQAVFGQLLEERTPHPIVVKLTEHHSPHWLVSPP